MKKLGRRGVMNMLANRRLQEKYLQAKITKCENCGSTFGLTFAHRKKRRYYSTVEQLSDMNETLLLCLICHQKIEFNKQLAEHIFSIKRP